MGIWNDPDVFSGGLLPGRIRIPEDRRTWWAIQFFAHVSVLIVLLSAGYAFYRYELTQEPDLSFKDDVWFFVAWLAIPSLITIQLYYVPTYYRVVHGVTPLWLYFFVAAIPLLLGLVFAPLYWYFVSEFATEALLFITGLITVLAGAAALLLHWLFRWWSRGQRNDDLVPPSSSRF